MLKRILEVVVSFNIKLLFLSSQLNDKLNTLLMEEQTGMHNANLQPKFHSFILVTTVK